MKKAKDFNERHAVSSYVEDKEYKALEAIAEREHKSVSQINRQIIIEHVKNHLAGNDSYTLNTWVDNIGFMALPALLERRQKWTDYVNAEDNKKSLEDVQRQCEFIIQIITSRLAAVDESSDENKKTKARVLEKFIAQNDIRFKDPAKLSQHFKEERIRLRRLSGLPDD